MYRLLAQPTGRDGNAIGERSERYLTLRGLLAGIALEGLRDSTTWKGAALVVVTKLSQECVLITTETEHAVLW